MNFYVGNDPGISFNCKTCGKLDRFYGTVDVICFECSLITNRCTKCGKIRTEYSEQKDKIQTIYDSYYISMFDIDYKWNGKYVKNMLQSIKLLNESSLEEFYITDIYINGKIYSESMIIDNKDFYKINFERDPNGYIKKVNIIEVN